MLLARQTPELFLDTDVFSNEPTHVFLGYPFDYNARSLKKRLDESKYGHGKAQEFLSLYDIPKLVHGCKKAVFVVPITRNSDMDVFLEISKSIADRIQKGSVQLLVMTEFLDERTLHFFKRLGCAEVLESSIKAKDLFSKVQRYVSLVDTFYRKEIRRKIRENFVHQAPNVLLSDQWEQTTQNKRNEIEKFGVKLSPPLPIMSDFWVLRGKDEVKKIMGNWCIHLIGPSPSAGQWVRISSALWRWSPDPRIDDMFTKESGHWFFTGQKPKFENLSWTFIGESPKLQFCHDETVLATKLKALNEQIISIARNPFYTADLLKEMRGHLKHFVARTKEAGSDIEKALRVEDSFFLPEKGEKSIQYLSEIFTLINRGREVHDFLEEACLSGVDVLIWFKGEDRPWRTAVKGIHGETRSFSLELLGSKRSHQFLNKIEKMGETSVFVSFGSRRARIFFRTELLGGMSNELELKIPDKVFEVQRRRNTRFGFPEEHTLPVVVDGVDSNNKLIRLNGFVSDVSSGGIGIRFPEKDYEKVADGITVDSIQFRLHGRLIRASGLVSHHRRLIHKEGSPYFIAGFKFDGVKPIDSQWLNFYILEQSHEYFLGWLEAN